MQVGKACPVRWHIDATTTSHVSGLPGRGTNMLVGYSSGSGGGCALVQEARSNSASTLPPALQRGHSVDVDIPCERAAGAVGCGPIRGGVRVRPLAAAFPGIGREAPVGHGAGGLRQYAGGPHQYSVARFLAVLVARSALG